MSGLVSLSEQLTDREWLDEIAAIGDDRGYFERIGHDHCALFLDESLDVLLVSFDTLASARGGSASGIPHAMLHAEVNGWSHLSVIATSATWFRDPSLYRFVDRLVDEGFFEDFETVIFYGEGVAGYAAAAYSVAAPGATVILASPIATLDPAIASWDDRYLKARHRDWRSRFGYAPDMLDAAGEVYLIFDPYEELDAMHAALFSGSHIRKIRFRNGGHSIGADLRAMGVLGPLFRAAAEGRLTASLVQRALRKRRDYGPYLRRLLNRVHIEDRDYLTALLSRAVLSRRESPRFRHHLAEAEKRLSEAGRSLPPASKTRRGADLLPRLYE